MSATTVVVLPLLIIFAPVLTVNLGQRYPVHHRNNPTPDSIQRSRSTVRTNATEKEFKASPDYKALPPMERPPVVAASPSAVASAISFSHRKHEIPIPALLALSY